MSVDQPAISIIMPIPNGSRYPAQTIDAMLGQTFKDFELLCVVTARTAAADDMSPGLVFFMNVNRSETGA